MGSRFLNPIAAGAGTAATIDVGIVSALAPGSGASVINVGTDTNAIFNFGIAVGADGAVGATGAVGPAGASSSIYRYRSDATVGPPPAAGSFSWNNATQILSTQIYIARIDSQATDNTIFLGLVRAGDNIVFQDLNSAGDFQVWDALAPGVASPTFYTFNVSLASSGGTGTTNLPDFHACAVIMQAEGSPGATGMQGEVGATGSTGPGGSSGGVGATGSTGPVGSSGGVGATGSTGPVGSSGGVGATGPVGSTGSSGGVGATGAAGSSTAGLGFSHIPICMTTATTILSGTKSYWYIIWVTGGTTLSNVNFYLTSGSDTARVAVYRGKTANSATTVLCGQTAATIPVGGGYYQWSLVLVAGQSLSFTNEFITVGFHSQGSTNTFLQGPASISDPALAYNNSSNFAAGGFPATLASVAVFSNLTTRLAFTFS